MGYRANRMCVRMDAAPAQSNANLATVTVQQPILDYFACGGS